jgi:hypothetical protein
MARSSKDLAKRLRFDRFPVPDALRRRFGLVGLAAALIGLAVWLALEWTVSARQYLPGPVSQNHATFGDRCETCHVAFESVADDACVACHGTRVHSTVEVGTPACRDCHVEHRHADVFLAVSNQSCIDCHRSLETMGAPPRIEAAIASFTEHPPFTPMREGAVDRAAVRFNHRLHLTSDNMPADDELTKAARASRDAEHRDACAICHRPADDGRLMQPILFERDCRRCHPQDALGPIGNVEAVHETPDVIREDLKRQLLVVAVDRADEVFRGQERILPGIVERAPADASATLAAYLEKWVGDSEEKLYAPFARPVEVGLTAPVPGRDAAGGSGPALLDDNRYCHLCHVPGAAEAGAAAVADDLPRIAETRIPARWLQRGEFSHRAHEMLECRHCHPVAAQSALTGDVNLPRHAVCLDCHVDGAAASAGTSCMLCHLYHDTSKDPARRASQRRDVSLETLRGH